MPIPRLVYAALLFGLSLAALSAGDVVAPTFKPKAPSAHNPCYDQKGLWGDDVKKSAYYAEKWEPARLLVWAKKGNFKGPVDSPENWLEYLPEATDGKVATKGPDAKTDIIFPDGDYTVEGPGGWEQQGGFPARHFTQGKGVHLKIRDPSILGNFWQFDGPQGWHIMEPRWIGNRHGFARNDNRKTVGHKIPHVSKSDGASVEYLGYWNNQDGWYVDNGVMILGPDVLFRSGPRHVMNIEASGTLVMLSGAVFQMTQPRSMWNDMTIKGKLLAGTPERPLTKDAFLYLNYKDPSDKATDRGLILRPEGSIAVTSADPKTARLVFALAKYPFKDKPDEQPSQQDADKGQEITMSLLGKVDFNGVEFNDFKSGGIEITSQAMRAGWKNIFYGKGNGGDAETLFKVISPASK